MKRAPLAEGQGHPSAAGTEGRAPLTPLSGWGLAGVAALGLALRLAVIRHGLPEFTEEAVPFRWSLAMWTNPAGRVDWNPHNFIYPSLVLYLHLAVQRIHLALGEALGLFHGAADYLLSYRLDPTPMVLAARGMGIAADLGTMLIVWRIGERWGRGAGATAAMIVACSPIMIRTSRAIFTDPVMTVLAVAALERMQAYLERPGTARRMAIALLIGLAAGAKYPAMALVLPFGWVLVAAHGPARAARLALPAVLAIAAVFLATTPFAILDAPTFMRDLRYDRSLAQQGLLGGTGPPSGWTTLRELWLELGPVAALLFAGGAIVAVRRARSTPIGMAILLAGVGFLAPVVLSPLRFERYLVGALPAAALLAGVAIASLLALAPASVRARAAAILALAVLVPAVAAAVPAALTGAITTQTEARAWCLAHLGPRDVILQEGYGARLYRRSRLRVEAGSPLVAAASPAVRARYLARPAFATVQLPVSVAGPCTALLHPRSGGPVELEVFPHAADFNQVIYDRRLLAGVDVVVTSEGTRGRFEADPSRYAVECAFYRFLDSTATVVARFRPHGRVSGPGIRVYRLPAATRAALADSAPLRLWWWTERIPLRYRLEANRILGASQDAGAEPTTRAGSAAPWVEGLTDVFRSRLAFFCEDLAENLIDLERFAPARRLMESEQEMVPENVWGCYLAERACRGLGDLAGARAAIERTAAARPGQFPADLVSEYADVLQGLGDVSRATWLRDSLATVGRK